MKTDQNPELGKNVDDLLNDIENKPRRWLPPPPAGYSMTSKTMNEKKLSIKKPKILSISKQNSAFIISL